MWRRKSADCDAADGQTNTDMQVVAVVVR